MESGNTEPVERSTFETEVLPVPGMPGIRKVRVLGRVTFHEAPELRATILREVRRPGTTKLVVDLGGIDRMDTAGMAVLVEGLLAGREKGLGLLLCEPSPSVLRIFHLAGFPEVLASCCSDFEEVRLKLKE